MRFRPRGIERDRLAEKPDSLVDPSLSGGNDAEIVQSGDMLAVEIEECPIKLRRLAQLAFAGAAIVLY